MLGDQIKKLRTAAKETQTGLAKKLSVSKQAVSNWENGNVQPSVDIVCRIARHYGCTTDYLLEMHNHTFYIETTYLTEDQQQQLMRIAREFEKLNKETGRFKDI
ncbi:MAG: helix-turn-helix transcriptional regulator [Lachnospiraceae bacterium]|nr:helix-turn-helix transcriptional regulator [Lachnospiraceae bacterium]